MQRCIISQNITGKARVRDGDGAIKHRTTARILMSSNASSDSSGEKIPFYGLPRPPKRDSHFNLPNNGLLSLVSDIGSILTGNNASRIALTLQHAATALRDPTRADAVAAVGELTGTFALQNLLELMKKDPDGRIILQERPEVSKESIPYDRLLESVTDDLLDPTNFTENTTFGQAYGAYLKKHGFDPDERDQVKYIDDPDMAYVMLRYRQNHDFWHTLTNLPPTVVGELGLKWLELFQTGMPLAAFSSTFGSIGLSYHDNLVLWNIYLPWARQVAEKLPKAKLMMIYYEREFDTPIFALRRRIGIEPVPPHVEGH